MHIHVLFDHTFNLDASILAPLRKGAFKWLSFIFDVLNSGTASKSFGAKNSRKKLFKSKVLEPKSKVLEPDQ